MEKKLEGYRKKAFELIEELEGIFGKKLMGEFKTCVVMTFDDFKRVGCDPKSFGKRCDNISKLLADIPISDTKVSNYRDILKKDFDNYKGLVYFEGLSNAKIFCEKMVEDLEKFVDVCKGFIVEGDTKAKLFHNKLIAACNEFTRQSARDQGTNLQVDLHLFCGKLVKIIKSRKKSSIISKLSSKSSSYLKEIIKNAEKLDKVIVTDKLEERCFGDLIESIKSAVDAGKKMKQRRKEHYPILSYPDVQKAFDKVIEIVSDAKKQLLDTKD